MHGERAEKNGHEKILTRKPCPNVRALVVDSKFAKKNFWHKMRRVFAKEITKEISEKMTSP